MSVPTSAPSARRLATAAFASLGIVWGASFIATKWAADTISAEQIALLRLVFGFLPLLVAVLAAGTLSRRDWRHSHHFLAMALLALGIPYVAFAKGTVLLPSGIAGMLSGAIPIFTFVIAFAALRHERMDARTVGGLAFGLLGVLLVARPWADDLSQTDPVGVLWLVGGSVSVAASFVYTKRFISPLAISPLVLVTWQTGLACLLVLGVTDLQGMGAVFADLRATIGLVLILGVLGTGIGFVLYYWIVDQLGAVAASGVTYLPPIVALAIGALIAGESVRVLDVAAMAAILSGVALLQARSGPAGRGSPASDA